MKNKPRLPLILLAVVSFAVLSAAAAECGAPAATPVAVEPSPSSCPAATNLYRVGRGLTNIGTCALEMPRCMLYDNSEVPFWGAIAGAFEGAGCTAMRAFAGVVDVISFGFDAGRVYDENFRDFVWQSKWLPATAAKQ